MFSRDEYDRHMTTRTAPSREYIAKVCGDYLEELDPEWTQGLEVSEVEWMDGEWTVDGMEPLEWCEAMTAE